MLRWVLREPLSYFLMAGAALFALAEVAGDDDGRRIVISAAERGRLADQWQAQMGRPPTATELEALIEQWIREEIYYREAIAMGLDENDVIIRRRLAQKLTFLTEDLATAEAPNEAALADYHQRHREHYLEPARWSFEHRYFSSERRERADADAGEALARLQAGEGGGAVAQGDPFMLQRSYAERSQREIAEAFGREFAAAIVDLPVGTWQGPVPSAYGWHVVKVEGRHSPRALPFAEVAERVAADLRQDQRRDANEAFYASLRGRYEIVRP